jgi:hypothetical protein
MTIVKSNMSQVSFSSSETIIIAPGVIVGDVATDAVVNGQYDSSTLINHGAILSSTLNGAGVFFSALAPDGIIVNAGDGNIDGYDAIDTAGTNTQVINFGNVTASNVGVHFDIGGGSDTLDNRGFIYSTVSGLHDNSVSAGDTFKNSGVIEGLQDGLVIQLFNASQFTTVINSGTLQGGAHAIIQRPGYLGALHLTNTGTLIGDIAMLGVAGTDVVTNTGHINGNVNLGGGSDTFNGSGGTSGRVDGGLGNDTVTGGPGRDQFLFDTALGPTNIDRITNYQHNVDKIDLGHATFMQAGAVGTLTAAAFFQGAAAHDPTDRIIYNPANGFLTYDANGNHAGGAIHFATLSLHLTLSNTDFLVTA